MVVGEATTLSCCCCRPCVLSILRACIDETQVFKRWSRGSNHGLLGVNDHAENLHRGYPLCPLYNWKGRAGVLGDRLLWMISSFVFKALSFRLLRAAQDDTLLNSAWVVLMCIGPTRR